jgi:hypothetical protein
MTRPIKACPGCWRSYDADQIELLPLVVVSPDNRREIRECGCGVQLEIERYWLAEARADELGSTPEVLQISPHVVLMLWPMPDGSLTARKVSLHHLRACVALLDEPPHDDEPSDNPPDTCAAP